MTTSLSPEIELVLRALAAVPGFKRAPKFKTRAYMLYVGDFGLVELRLVQSAPGDEVSIVLERLKATTGFRICIGASMQNYGLIAPHKVRVGKVEVVFFSLPDGFFAPEFIQAFSGEAAALNLGQVDELGWCIVLASEQIEVIVPVAATEEQITLGMERVLRLATHPPFSARERKQAR